MTHTTMLHDVLGAESERSACKLDVVGIGALNLDYIADSTALAESPAQSLVPRLYHLAEQAGVSLEWGTERLVAGDTIQAAIEIASPAQLHAVLGGSAFNAIRAIAQTQVGLRLGYVGVAGRVPVTGLSTVEAFKDLGIDHQFVRQARDHLCGICLSFTEGGDRTLLTHAGANDQMADYLDQDFAEIVAYLASARIVHVTSFLDSSTAEWLLAVLREVRTQNPSTLICFDPGHMWSVEPSPEVEELIRLSDYLLVNNREFCELGGQHPDEPDESVAARLLARFEREQGRVVVKRATGIHCYRRENGSVAGDFYPQAPLSTEDIEDTTGAGDVFAAGLLIVLACDRLQVELGALLGMRLARHKLRYVGSAGDAAFAEVARDFVAELDAERRSDGQAKGVFIGHGANPEWLAVQRFIEDRFSLPVYSFESASWSSRPVTDALADYLDRCSFAICILTAEDFTGDGKRLARQNVVHEVGLFQGRHGFDRVLVLAEDGCDFVPRAAEPYTIRFPRNGISRALYRVGETLRKANCLGGVAGQEATTYGP